MKSYKVLGLLLLMLLTAVSLAACGGDATPAVVNSGTTATSATTTTVAPITATSQTGSASVAATIAPTSVPALATATPLPTTAAATTVAVSTTRAASTTSTAVTKPQAIRSTDWPTVYKADEKQIADHTLAGPCELINGKEGLYGTPAIDQIVYLDMDGDGMEEAVVPLASGGTAGNLSFLVYKYAQPRPTIADCGSGYKLGVQLDNKTRQLQVVQGVSMGWEPNCCPSGLSYTDYVLTSGKLTKVSRYTEGYAESRGPVVEYFYSLLDQKKFKEAYDLLAPAYQKANPFGGWSAGYASTHKVSAVATNPNPKDTTGIVKVVITSVDGGSGGKEVTKTFEGSWQVLWDAGLEHWTLSNPAIKETTAAGAVGKGTIVANFQAFGEGLKKLTKVPLYLPTYLGNPPASSPQIYASLGETSNTLYYISLGLTPGCDANACSWGSISGQDITGLTGIIVDPNRQPVTLVNGTKGYFIPFSCGASCGPSYLEWQEGGRYSYTVSLKGGSQEEILKIANSMITNGRLN